ncbi:MAG: hypothetical protein RM368_36155 [Nostoc sp. DedSLP03]|uniref:hypothetical protein n=1 Tax=Nostoc sp. DedSLP03 TaxID=3075400 RepID=UPI002AD29E5A|nr:hypothetical protein [Nostoc sp. DedSLP03]MDZ7970305.1 hypothetical protein [Nostoc sp. DedSLP03]
MSKPLGYYTNYTPGDDSLLATLQDKYGAAFEKISKREKLVILTALASHVGCQLEGDCREEIFTVAKQMIEQLTIADQTGIMEAIIVQIRWGQNFVVEKQESPMQQ